jgi:quercetin dioxygenase-like cupin family protein
VSKCKTAAAVLILTAIPLASAIGQALAPTPVFEETTTTSGPEQPVRVSIQSWGISGQDHAAHEIPLPGFYVAHLISGHISATIDGRTVEHLPGDYWGVKLGSSMQVKVLGEVAVLETILVSKQ